MLLVLRILSARHREASLELREYYLNLAEELHKAGAHILCIKVAMQRLEYLPLLFHPVHVVYP